MDGATAADAFDAQTPDAQTPNAQTSPDDGPPAPDAAPPDAAPPDAALPDAKPPDAAPDATAAPDAADDAATPQWLAGPVRCGSGACAEAQVCVYTTNVDPPQGPRCSQTLSPERVSDCPAGPTCRGAMERECGTMTLNLNVATRHLTCCFGGPGVCPTL